MEDTDKDMSVDESSIMDKSHDLTLLKEQMTMELSENTRELIMDETAKILCKVCLGNITRNKENVPEVLIYCSQCSSTSKKIIKSTFEVSEFGTQMFLRLFQVILVV